MTAATDAHTAPASAGPLSWRDVSGPELRDVRVDGAVALDGLYFAVRDEIWGTVAGSLVSTSTHVDGDERREVSEWLYRSDTVHLRATLVLTVTPGTLSLDATSVAVGAQVVRRVGMCLLHPLELRGAEVELRHSGGQAERSAFPTEISPHQPFLDLAGMTEHLTGGAALDIAFEGAVFETEDHRNWTDAGWKTYSPPLADPSPLHLADGDRLWQRVTLTARPAHTAGDVRPASARPELLVRVGEPGDARVPRLGAGVSGLETAALSPAGLSFLLCEVLDDDHGVERLEAAVAEARLNALPLAVLLVCTADRADQWSGVLRGHSDVIEGVTLVDPDSRVTPTAAGSRLRELLEGTGIRVGAGTRGYGAELGRAHETFSGADYVQLSASAMVHHSDDERVMDTVRAYPDLVRHARRAAGAAPLLLGPITLAERLTLHEDPFGGYAPYDPAFSADPRSREDFAAAWAVGVIAGAAGVSALSFFWGGPGGGLEKDGEPSPAARVLQRIGRHSGDRLCSVTVSDPRRIAALAWRETSGRTVACVANLTPDDVTVSVAGADIAVAGADIAIAPYRVAEVAIDG